ncbi:MAG: ATP-grasp domain-containing protein [Clostridia bacterium]|nr:ATP-grasp domain-containing protein [Clostridia bacterium]
MKKILVLGTGMPQGDLMIESKSQGLEVFACSYKEGYKAQKYADHFELINIVDADKVEEYAKKIGADIVYSAGSDVAMPTAFTVSERLGLPCFCSSEAALICNRKPLLRKTLGNFFEGNLKHQKVFSADEEITVPFPIMMKPTDSQGQRGVCRVNNAEEFKENFERSVSYSREGAVILEEFVEGDEISVNTFSKDGKLIFFLPSERVTWSDFPGGIIHRHILPGKFGGNDEINGRVRDLVERTLNKLGINNGPAYFQIMINKDGIPKLVEVTPRLDGCHMWRLIKYSTGVDLLAMTVGALLGQAPEREITFEVKPYETEFLCMPPDSVFDRSAFTVAPYDFLEWYYEDGETVNRMNGYMEKCGLAIRGI